MEAPLPLVAVRGSNGISINYGPPSYETVASFVRDDRKSCKAMLFDLEGKYFAWVNGLSVKIVETSDCQVIADIARPKVSTMKFSPKGTYLMTWEAFTVSPDNPQGGPNLHIWKTEGGTLVHKYVHKKQLTWEPQWTSDERYLIRLVNAQVQFYEAKKEGGEFEPAGKINAHKVEQCSVSPGPYPFNVLCYCLGQSGQPSNARIYQFPKLNTTEALASKSFFQADKVEIMWNMKGTGALFMTSMEVDKSGSSYYGKQSLHYLSPKGDTAMVLLSKEGPIYSVAWSPKSTEFCVVYGFVPAKATLFNIKCEPVFEFGTGPRNCIHYNPQGNILILGGFGNLPGNVEIWDVCNRKKIIKIEAPDTTLLQWSPDGKHFATATTAPRLRIDNGFKIWHYSGTLLYERPWNKQDELWEVLWQPFPYGIFKPESISYKPVEGIQPSQPQASKQAYRPPSARGRDIKFKLHDDDELPSGGADPANPSKLALKKKKSREARKAKKEQESQQQQQGGAANGNEDNSPPTSGVRLPPNIADLEMPEDPDKSKKFKKLKSKLLEIYRLREQKESGKQLELNQEEKIKKEAELVKEITSLVL